MCNDVSSHKAPQQCQQLGRAWKAGCSGSWARRGWGVGVGWLEWGSALLAQGGVGVPESRLAGLEPLGSQVPGKP